MNFSVLGLLKKSLSAKLISVFILFLFIFLIYTTLYLIFFQTQVRAREVIHRGRTISALLAGLSDLADGKDSAGALCRAVDTVIKQKNVLAVSVYNREGLVLERWQPREKNSHKLVLSQSEINPEDILRRLSESPLPYHVAGNMIFDIFYPVVKSVPDKTVANASNSPEKNGVAGFVHMKLKRYDTGNRTVIVFFKNLLSIAVFFVLGAVIIFFTVRSITLPLKQLTGAVNDLEQGKCSAPVQIHSEDEVGSLAKAFNRMSDSIKKREHDLESSRERLMLALEAANEVLWDLEVPSNTVTMIPQSYPLLGYHSCEIKSFSDLIHPEDRDQVVRVGENFVRQKRKAYAHEFRMKAKNGKYRWIMSRGQTVAADKDGNPLRVIGTHVDITDLKEAEKQIRELSRKIITAQETERQRISRDLHDHVAQNLSFLKIASQQLFGDGKAVSVEVKQKAENIAKTLDACIQEIREISYDLRPPELDQLGLAEAVYKFCHNFSKRCQINIDTRIAGMDKTPLDADMEINIYRIIQEGMNNIHKHAEATRATITLLGTFPDIFIRIEDNGKGFDYGADETGTVKGKQMGLVNIKERVRLMNGEISFVSRQNQGTKIQITFPCKES